MSDLTRSVQLGFAAVLAAVCVCGAAPSGPGVIENLDLSKSLSTRSNWSLTASQGPSETGVTGEAEPGEVRLCLHRDAVGLCDPQLRGTLGSERNQDAFSRPHYLNSARVVQGRAGRPLLLVQTASQMSGDGDQRVLTQALAYRPGADRFERVYDHLAGRNNDQQVRYVETGPLKGDFISADPTQDAPYGFWIVVSAPADGEAYRDVLRYRSATRYGDGNPLAVIDSEMPNIEQRLGLWRPGEPLPTPAKGCARPHLVRKALWCG